MALLSPAGWAYASDASPLTIAQYVERLRAYQAGVRDLATAKLASRFSLLT